MMNSLFSVSNTNTSNWFNSMMGGSSKASNSTNSIFSSDMLSNHAMIKNGTFLRLAKTYYASGKATSFAGSTEDVAEKKALTDAKSNASALQESVAKLTTTGADSVFKREMVEDEKTGQKNSQYNTDNIYKAVKGFVDSYNEVVDETIDSDTVSVLRKTLNMIQTTKANESMLSKVGITIGADNKLSVDEDAFKKASMTDVKSLFNGSSSMGGRIESQASELYRLAENNIAKIDKGTYTGSGSYTTSASMIGSLYDTTW